MSVPAFTAHFISNSPYHNVADMNRKFGRTWLKDEKSVPNFSSQSHYSKYEKN